MLVGSNAPPQHGFKPEDIASGGLWTVRFPLWRDFDYRPYIDGLRLQGIEPVPVLDRATFSAADWKAGKYESRITELAELYPDLRYVQGGNEPDADPGASASSAQTKARYFRLMGLVRSAWPNATVLGAGLAKINFSYYGCPDADVECFHPYGKWIDQDDPQYDLDALIDAIQTHTDKPLAVTEFGHPIDSTTSQHDRAVWHSEIAERLWRRGITMAVQFPYHRWMHDGFDGMVGSDDVITEVWPAMEGAARNLYGAPPPPGGSEDFYRAVIDGIQDAIGLPYIFGGRQVPPQAGYDCAGFVLEAFNRQGINLCYVPPFAADPFPEYNVGKWYTSAQRLFDNPKLAPTNEAERGDIIFFTRTYPTPDYITHVGIVLDEDHYIGAQGPVAGTINWRGSSYWSSRLAGFRRVVR